MSSIANAADTAVITAVSNEAELPALARRIKERDLRAVKYAHAQWLENGRDLITAKAILGHGKFEEWCERALSYTPRTAQKLMRAAEVWGPILETEPSSGLPKPTVVYALSARSVPPSIRDRFAARVIAGEDVLSEARVAIKQHRETAKEPVEQEARRATQTPEAREANAKRERSKTQREAHEAEELRVTQERQAAARFAALALIQARLGDDLPELLALAVEGGGGVFSFYAERELQAHAQALVRPTDAEDDHLSDEPEIVKESSEAVTGDEARSLVLLAPSLGETGFVSRGIADPLSDKASKEAMGAERVASAPMPPAPAHSHAPRLDWPEWRQSGHSNRAHKLRLTSDYVPSSAMRRGHKGPRT